MTNEKHFPKTISQWEFDYGLFTNLPRIIFACNSSPSSFKLRRGILLSRQNTYPNLRTTCHTKLKFFLLTKLLANLLLAKYLISVAAPLSSFSPISAYWGSYRLVWSHLSSSELIQAYKSWFKCSFRLIQAPLSLFRHIVAHLGSCKII